MSKKEVVCDKAPSAIGTYSQAVIAGNFIFVSGQIPLDYKDMTVCLLYTSPSPRDP